MPNPDIGRMIDEELTRGSRSPESEIRRVNKEPASTSTETPRSAQSSAERESDSLGADYILLQESMKNPQLAEPLKDAFKEKLIASALGAEATPEMEEQLRQQKNIWDFLDTFLKGPASAEVVIKQMTRRLNDRLVGIRSAEEKKRKY